MHREKHLVFFRQTLQGGGPILVSGDLRSASTTGSYLTALKSERPIRSFS
jgi:hypothetical protein